MFDLIFLYKALKPADIMAFFAEATDQAYEIQDAFNKQKGTELFMKVPTVTVFLDEVNTASCLGLFKEIMVDRSIDGMVGIGNQGSLIDF